MLNLNFIFHCIKFGVNKILLLSRSGIISNSRLISPRETHSKSTPILAKILSNFTECGEFPKNIYSKMFPNLEKACDNIKSWLK